MGKVDALFMDSFHDSMEEAVKEAHIRKLAGEPSITTVEPSPYGGWRVRSVSADFAVDMMADTFALGTSLNRRVYG